MPRAQQYGISELRELLSLTMAPHIEDHSFEYDRFGDRLVVYLIDRTGVWLSVAGDLSERHFKRLTGFDQTELQKRGLTKSGVRVWSRSDGAALLPIPFTLQQASRFDQEAEGIITECLDWGEDTQLAIDGMPAKSAELARALLNQSVPRNPSRPGATALLREHERLKTSGCRNPTATLAAKYGLADSYIRRIVRSARQETTPRDSSPIAAAWRSKKSRSKK